MSSSFMVFLPVCFAISSASRAISCPSSSRIFASAAAPLSETLSAPEFLISLSTGATGMMVSLFFLGI